MNTELIDNLTGWIIRELQIAGKQDAQSKYDALCRIREVLAACGFKNR